MYFSFWFFKFYTVSLCKKRIFLIFNFLVALNS